MYRYLILAVVIVLVGLPHTPRHMLMAARASARFAELGAVPMPPNALKDEDLRALVKWVLSGAPG